MISVVVPLYNKEGSIRHTISSILNQTYQNFEIIVVDDGSTDNSLKLVREICDGRLNVFSQKNEGVSSARNTGILKAKFPFIAFIDGDDLWLPSHLEVLAKMIKKYGNNDVGGYATKFIKSKSREIESLNIQSDKVKIIDDYIVSATYEDRLICSSNFIARKDCLLDVGSFNVTYSYGEDVDLWLRLFTKYKLVTTDIITAIYFIGAENRSDKRILPLSKRFSNYNYEIASPELKCYYDKLVSILILDYAMQGAYRISFSLFWKFKHRFLGISHYYLRLFRKWIAKYSNRRNG